MPYVLFLAGAVSVASAVALTHISSISRVSGNSRIAAATLRSINLIADTAISVGYSEGSDGRPVLPSTLTYMTGSGAPMGGSLIPAGLKTSGKDGWGATYGFCDFSAFSWSGWTTPLFAVLSSGQDRSYQTTCSDVFAGLRRGDDLVRVTTAADWRLSAARGKTDSYRPPIALLSELQTLKPAALGEVRLVQETKEVYINPTGVAGSANWQLVSGAGSSSGRYVKRDERGYRKWSDGTVAASCQAYLQAGAGYAYSGDIGDGLYWINPAGVPYGVYCDMTTELAGRSFYTDLVAYWPMDEAFGTTAFDLMRTHDFTVNSVPSAGIISGIGKLVSGKNPVSIPELTIFNPNQITISAWLDTSTFAANAMFFGFNLWDAYACGRQGTVSINTGAGDCANVRGPSGKHHYVFVFDRRPAPYNGMALDERIYIDGVRQPLSLAGSPNGANRVWQSILNFGGWSYDNEPTFWASNSYYDDVALWKRALTDAEVSVLYNSRAPFGGMLTAHAGFIKRSNVWSNADGSAMQSCAAYQRAGARENALYLVNQGDPFSVYCDQTSDGGGWTLIMKQAAGDGSTLQGDSIYWKQGVPLNDSFGTQNLANANFVSRAFAAMPASSYRLQASNESTRRFNNTGSVATPMVAFSDALRTNYSDPYGVPGNWLNWSVYATSYPDGQVITSARFAFNFMEVVPASGALHCGARWGWSANQDPPGAADGSHDACGGLGAWGSRYGASQMNNNPNAWQPATLFLWAR
ncbi:fibrinogen-like YCDxxxxGGGW domain-containing protein [Cupriavidus metallidurans]|uniref:fibrinogen-like YCDxxxxGGGW domain-containing protein n=1 Tax=Cupriavidus metallidurans TaxID=119219 RepID=UPI0013642E92|nr:fibrinogen-like YCDxxxxGGGW domain-containing protein [Cupriavidus metallidurans]